VGLLVLELWHEVQVELFIPEKPEMPLLLAFAGTGARVSATVMNTIRVTKWGIERPNVFRTSRFEAFVKISERALWVSGDLRSSTVASFLSPSQCAHEGRGTKECICPLAENQQSEHVPEIEQLGQRVDSEKLDERLSGGGVMKSLYRLPRH
jgi:hypothetical protein